jgi:hypothetical protein
MKAALAITLCSPALISAATSACAAHRSTSGIAAMLWVLPVTVGLPSANPVSRLDL